jgi:hypothetical protein
MAANQRTAKMAVERWLRARPSPGGPLSLCAIAAAVIAVSGSPTPHADADGYLRCVKGGLGGYDPNDDALSLGQTVSQLLAHYQPPEAIANMLYSNGATGFILSGCQTIVARVQHVQPL